MKIKQEIEDHEDGTGSCITITIDGKRVFSACDGEPEDNNLCRNFNGCFNIVDMLKQAFEAGKRGETLEIEHVGD